MNPLAYQLDNQLMTFRIMSTQHNNVMLSVDQLCHYADYCNADYHYTESPFSECIFSVRHFAEYYCAECLYVECHLPKSHYSECLFAERHCDACHYSGCHCTDFHYVECHYPECLCALITTRLGCLDTFLT
jgi:hypothetical protein